MNHRADRTESLTVRAQHKIKFDLRKRALDESEMMGQARTITDIVEDALLDYFKTPIKIPRKR